MKVRIHLSPGASMPRRGSTGASGYDLAAMEHVTIYPGHSTIIQTGVHVEMPPGMEAQVRPRSSMSRKGIIIPLGTIDSDYRGEIGVVAFNASQAAYAISPGDRIAQLVFARVEHPAIEIVDELSATERGAGGWGSTGR